LPTQTLEDFELRAGKYVGIFLKDRLGYVKARGLRNRKDKGSAPQSFGLKRCGNDNISVNYKPQRKHYRFDLCVRDALLTRSIWRTPLHFCRGERPETSVTDRTGYIGTLFPFFGEGVMPWKECSVMDERLQFVAELCREFGISRKTGYKIFDRYQECGVQG
jgi:hypothetical protein